MVKSGKEGAIGGAKQAKKCIRSMKFDPAGRILKSGT